MSKKQKWLLSIVIALLLALFAFTAAGPYMAINGIRKVIASGQYGELQRYVDFDRLRESVRPQIQEKIVGGLLQRMGAGAASRAVSRVTNMISEPAIDAMVSPVGIATLLYGSVLAKQVTGQQDADGKVRATDPLKEAKTRFESPSLFTATVESNEGKPVVFEFSRKGLSWKLTGIRLPE
ncbi:MAG: DUF2939 domain-containing protein [Thermomonas sp.]|uniref:DUF2939 domain-containing protein n=1 Tax=Thermomonas sp. TaxID=1971895 RepID=UPI0039E6FD4B